MKTKEWYRAHLRWAVMVEGKEELRPWEESVYLFLSEDQNTAFRRAAEIGRTREVVTLDRLGNNQTEFAVRLDTKKPSEQLPF